MLGAEKKGHSRVMMMDGSAETCMCRGEWGSLLSQHSALGPGSGQDQPFSEDAQLTPF